MSEGYIFEYANLLERVLSAANSIQYSTVSLEREISASLFFQKIEKSGADSNSYVSEGELIKSIFPNERMDFQKIPSYNQCLWAAECYIRIQHASKFTFELIFAYLPIEKMYQLFDLYHEMDFSQIIDLFLDLYKKESVLDIYIKKMGFSVKELSKILDMSESTLNSFRTRRRKIEEGNVFTVFKLATFFRVRVETMAELKQ